MKFEVPQFVDVEDKIIGPLTWKQFVFLAGGAGAGVVFFLILPFWAFLFIGLPFVLLGAGLAFYRVNNRPLSITLEAMSSYFSKSRFYLWQRQGAQPTAPRTEAAGAPTPAPLPPPLPTGAGNIASLSRKLEVHAMEGNVAEGRK